MTSLDDLQILYKLALEFDLVAEREWLKQQIEEQLANAPAQNYESEKSAA